jgi:hypothetical protein
MGLRDRLLLMRLTMRLVFEVVSDEVVVVCSHESEEG